MLKLRNILNVVMLVALASIASFAQPVMAPCTGAGSEPFGCGVTFGSVTWPQTQTPAFASPVDFFNAASLDDLNAQIRTFKTQTALRAALANFYRHFPLILWKSGDPLPSGFAFDAVLVSDANFPELFPVYNRRPLTFFGRVIVPAPGYDPAKPTIYGERAIPTEAASIVVNQVYSVLSTLPQ